MTEKLPSARRRQVLASAAVTAVGGLAGCTDGLTTREFRADPYGAGRQGMVPFGFEQSEHETIERSRDVSLSVLEGTVVTESHVVSYGQDARVPETSDWAAREPRSWSAGVLATPQVQAGDETLNPYATRPLEDLLTGERSEELLSVIGVDGEDTRWVSGPVSIGSQPGTMLERETEIDTWLGVATTGSRPVPIAVYGSRVQVDDDAILAGLVDRRAFPGGVSPAEYIDATREYVGEAGLAAIEERFHWTEWFMRVIEKISPPIVVDVDLNAVDVVFVLDKTVGGALPDSNDGSDGDMSESKTVWALREGAVRNVVEGLPGAAKVGLVTYDAFVDLRQELTFDGSKVTDDLGQYYQEGGDPSEALVNGLAGGYEELTGVSRYSRISPSGNDRDYAKKVMIVISDGHAAPRFETKPEMIAGHVKSIPAEVYCISFSESANAEKLATVASEPTETYYLQGPSRREIASSFSRLASAP